MAHVSVAYAHILLEASSPLEEEKTRDIMMKAPIFE